MQEISLSYGMFDYFCSRLNEYKLVDETGTGKHMIKHTLLTTGFKLPQI